MDLLDDIRKYLKGRVALEMQYADGMQKLSATYLSHKIANVPDIQTEENEQVRHRDVIENVLLKKGEQ